MDISNSTSPFRLTKSVLVGLRRRQRLKIVGGFLKSIGPNHRHLLEMWRQWERIQEKGRKEANVASANDYLGDWPASQKGIG